MVVDDIGGHAVLWSRCWGALPSGVVRHWKATGEVFLSDMVRGRGAQRTPGSAVSAAGDSGGACGRVQGSGVRHGSVRLASARPGPVRDGKSFGSDWVVRCPILPRRLDRGPGWGAVCLCGVRVCVRSSGVLWCRSDYRGDLSGEATLRYPARLRASLSRVRVCAMDLKRRDHTDTAAYGRRPRRR